MRTALPCLLIWLYLPGVLSAQGTIDYARDVKPLLQKKCHACHGTLWQNSGLRLDVGRLILEGGTRVAEHAAPVTGIVGPRLFG